MKFNYEFTESIVQRNDFAIESDIKLSEDEVRELTSECMINFNKKFYNNNFKYKDKDYVIEGEKEGNRYKVTFVNSEYDDNTKEEFGGDKYKED